MVGHPLHRLHDRERQHPQPRRSSHLCRAVRSRSHPARRMRHLHGFGSDHPLREFIARRLVFKILFLPHPADDLYGFTPVFSALIAIHAEGCLLHRGGASRAPFHTPFGENIHSGDLLGDALRRGEAERGERHAEPHADVLREHRQRAQQHFGSGAVRAAFSEVVLYGPDGVEAQRVGQPDLFYGFLVGALLTLTLPPRVRLSPRFRGVYFVENI